ncbi:MAG TPA: hypothetical protein ACHBX0_07175 [Arsenophonus sp.]
MFGAAVGVGTVLALLVSSSAAGPISVGAALMLGGMTYNAVTTVAELSKQ